MCVLGAAAGHWPGVLRSPGKGRQQVTVPLEQRAARAPADGESERPPWFCGTLVWGRGARGPQCLPPAQGRGGHPGGPRSGRRLLPCLSGASRWRSERKVNKAVREARVPRGRPPGRSPCCRPGAPPPGCEPAWAAPLAVVGKWPSPSAGGFHSSLTRSATWCPAGDGTKGDGGPFLRPAHSVGN